MNLFKKFVLGVGAMGVAGSATAEKPPEVPLKDEGLIMHGAKTEESYDGIYAYWEGFMEGYSGNHDEEGKVIEEKEKVKKEKKSKGPTIREYINAGKDKASKCGHNRVAFRDSIKSMRGKTPKSEKIYRGYSDN